MKSLALVLATAAAGLAVDAAPAAACSPPPCWPAFFVPANATRVPANLPGLVWRPMQSAGGTQTFDPSNVTLVSSADPATPLAFTATQLDNGDYLIVPEAPLVAGTVYFLTDASECEAGGITGPSVTFEVGPEAPLPAQLGNLVAFDPIVDRLTVGTASGSCSSEVTAAAVAVQLDPSIDVEPWLDVLQFETLVDGRPWRSAASINDAPAPGESWIGRARDVVYAVCASSDSSAFAGVTEGPHTITLRATLPGRTEVLSASSDPVILDCDAVEPPICDGDHPCAAASQGCASGAPGSLAWLGLALVGLVRRRRV